MDEHAAAVLISPSPGQANQAGPPSHEALVALYNETWNEIARLRDTEWRIAYYFATISAGLIAFLTTDTSRSVLTAPIQTIVTVVQCSAAVFAVWQLFKTHEYLTQQRNIRRHIEEAFGFYDPGVYSAKSMLPQEWKGQEITGRFQRSGLLFPLVAMVIVVQAASILVLWTADRYAGLLQDVAALSSHG